MQRPGAAAEQDGQNGAVGGAIREGGILEGSHLRHLVAVARLETGDGSEALWRGRERGVAEERGARSSRWKYVGPDQGGRLIQP